MMADSDRQVILAIVLGASEWPLCHSLPSATSFARSARDFVSYLRSADGLAIPEENLLDLFDKDFTPDEIDSKISDFLIKRQRKLNGTESTPTDLVLYYIGHGGFSTTGQDYFFAIRKTREKGQSVSSVRVADLATTLKRDGKNLRRYLILDCCFAAAAFPLFQGGGITDGIKKKTLNEFPKKGTALLCAASKQDFAINPLGGKYTMFSGALLNALRKGDESIKSDLSLSQVGERVEEEIQERSESIEARPQVLCPDQSQGDIAELPLFPNVALKRIGVARLLPSRQEAVLASRIQILISSLRSRVFGDRSHAINELRILGPDAIDAIDELVAALSDSDDRIRRGAAEVLGSLGEKAAKAVPSLLDALSTENRSFQPIFISALGKIGPNAADAVPALIKILDAKYEFERTEKVDGLISRVKNLLSVQRDNAHTAAIVALGQIGSSSMAAVPTLIKDLSSEDEIARTKATKALGQIGPAASDAVPQLIEIFENADQAIRSIKTENSGLLDAIQRPSDRLRNRLAEVRQAALFAIGSIGPNPKRVTTPLANAVDENEGTHTAIANEPVPIDAIDQLIKDVSEGEDVIRKGAAEALGDLGEKAAKAVPSLLHALSNESRFSQPIFISALGKIGPKAADAVPNLIKLMDTGYWLLSDAGQTGHDVGPIESALNKQFKQYHIYIAAIVALGQIGPSSIAAIPVLTEALGSKNEFIRSKAATALDQIGPPPMNDQR